MNEKLDNIYLSVEHGYNIHKTAKAYVEAFNNCGSHMITKYECRRPTEKELNELKKYSDGVDSKNIFVVVIVEYKKIPDNLVKLRPKVDFKIEVPRDEENEK